MKTLIKPALATILTLSLSTPALLRAEEPAVALPTLVANKVAEVEKKKKTLDEKRKELEELKTWLSHVKEHKNERIKGVLTFGALSALSLVITHMGARHLDKAGWYETAWFVGFSGSLASAISGTVVGFQFSSLLTARKNIRRMTQEIEMMLEEIKTAEKSLDEDLRILQELNRRYPSSPEPGSY